MPIPSQHLSFTPPTATPIVKWAGGKGRLLPQLRPLMPAGVERMRLVEPFAGGAAVFFGLAPQRALLCDVNRELIALYRVVQQALPTLTSHLRRLAAAHCREHYYAVRLAYNEHQHCSVAERAAWFLYLNKTCFNGLHRVNRRGEFNVPMGRYKRPRILDVDGLAAASAALQRVDLRCGDFATTLELARAGDFVYLDPPYEPVSKTASFTAYAKAGFGPTDQVRLTRTFAELDRRGCHVMLSNSDSPTVRELYAGFSTHQVRARRSISRQTDSRADVRELVISNYR